MFMQKSNQFFSYTLKVIFFPKFTFLPSSYPCSRLRQWDLIGSKSNKDRGNRAEAVSRDVHTGVSDTRPVPSEQTDSVTE